MEKHTKMKSLKDKRERNKMLVAVAVVAVISFVLGVLIGMPMGVRVMFLGVAEMLAYGDVDLNIEINLNETELAEEFRERVVPDLIEGFNKSLEEKE